MRYHSAAGARQASAGQIVVIGLIAFGIAALLNADSLYVTASRQPFGWQRTVTRQLVAPFRSISHATGLSRPRAAMQRAIGRDPQAGTRRGSSITVPVTTTPPPGAPTTAPTTTSPPRVQTAEHPLTLWVGGDSMVQEFGSSVVELAGKRGTIKAELDYRVSTGLTRPDYFNWPGHLHDEVLPKHPEVVVIMFGANDAQPMEVDGRPYKVRSPEWQREYRTLVALTMDLLAADHRTVLWVGQPHMRSGEFTERMDILNGIFSSEAAKRPWIRFLDSGPVLAPPGGGYSAYLPGGDGQPQLARTSDGVHLSRFGANRLAAAVMGKLDAELAAGAHAGAPPTPAVGGEATPSGGRGG